jgi:hypothetical protein
MGGHGYRYSAIQHGSSITIANTTAYAGTVHRDAHQRLRRTRPSGWGAIIDQQSKHAQVGIYGRQDWQTGSYSLCTNLSSPSSPPAELLLEMDTLDGLITMEVVSQPVLR